MRHTFFLVLAIVAIALGGFGVAQWRKNQQQKQVIGGLESRTAEQAEQIDSLQTAAREMERAQQESLQIASKLAERGSASAGTGTSNSLSLAEPTAGVSNAPREGGEFGEMVSKMMQDPQMKKMIAETQRLMIGRLYSPLFKKLGLSPEETDQFKKLLADSMVEGTEQAMGLMGAGAATNRSELMTQLQENQKAQDEKIRSFLGEGRYAEYQAYQETVGERAQISMWREQAGDAAPTEQQTEALLGIIAEERKNLPFPASSANPDVDNLEAMFSEDQFSKLMESQETLNQRVLERAKGTLNPEQWASLGAFQTNQLATMRLSMEMARKMFSPEPGKGK